MCDKRSDWFVTAERMYWKFEKYDASCAACHAFGEQFVLIFFRGEREPRERVFPRIREWGGRFGRFGPGLPDNFIDLNGIFNIGEGDDG